MDVRNQQPTVVQMLVNGRQCVPPKSAFGVQEEAKSRNDVEPSGKGGNRQICFHQFDVARDPRASKHGLRDVDANDLTKQRACNRCHAACAAGEVEATANRPAKRAENAFHQGAFDT
ncbi:hypothetical protein MesoLj131c_63480 [Mesorhizobium sp. 131-3-5]|nr:hypothetical protein MesoLj131c_63480 [Mesorhizobium sp. 131-3-5]